MVVWTFRFFFDQWSSMRRRPTGLGHILVYPRHQRRKYNAVVMCVVTIQLFLGRKCPRDNMRCGDRRMERHQ